MTSRISQWTIDAHDVRLMAEFWGSVLDYRIDAGDDGCAKLYPPDDADASTLTVWVQRVDEPKQVKNRSHPDLNVVADAYESEVERILALGATRADVGQEDTDPFVVFADPEGNEFCLLQNQPR